MTELGFVILSHDRPRRLERLVATLARMFERPRIVIHHDFARCPLDLARFPGVEFVVPHFATGWGEWSVVEGMLAALRRLLADGGPDWIALLSGADYPIKDADAIVTDLERSPGDAWLRHEPIHPFRLGSRFRRLCYRRYQGRRFRVPWLDRRLRPIIRRATISLPGVRRWDWPFPFACYAGEFWFTANRRAARHLLEVDATDPPLRRRYRGRVFPDESYVHCILKAAPQLTVIDDCRRYIDWNDPHSSHPKTLGIADLPAMLASTAHFARKMDPEVDASVYDRLDEAIGVSESSRLQ